MEINILVPSLGESITEANIVKWHKNIGDYIKVDELLVELETDKITLEVNSPDSGIITEKKFNDGDTVNVSNIIGIIQKHKIDTKQELDNIEDNCSKKLKIMKYQQDETTQVLSPAAIKIAAENSIQDIDKGTGKDGRITKNDVLSTILKRKNQASLTPDQSCEEKKKKVKMTKLRQTIAKRLKDYQNTAAILSTFNEVDMSSILEIRQKHQDSFREKYGIKLGLMSFFVKIVIKVLKEIPVVNAETDNDHLIYNNYYNIGVAVGTDKGLIVPTIRNADKMSYADIEKNLSSLKKKAREGKITISDIQDGTFSITNGGIYGSLLSTPLINPPQSAILAMHNIIKRPVAVLDDIVIKPMMYIALSYDHRIIDGSIAVTFLRRVKEIVEDPEILFLGL